MRMAVPKDCTACGACCFSPDPTYLRLYEADVARLDRDDLVRRDGDAWFMLMVDGRCAALRADPWTSRFLCSVYGRRPDVCRSLARGSFACVRHHEEKGGRAAEWCEGLRRLVGIV